MNSPHRSDFGGKLRFSGQVSTVKCFENNPLVRKALEEQGNGRVLVVDGGGSKRCALLGDNIAEMAHKNGWSVSGSWRCCCCSGGGGAVIVSVPFCKWQWQVAWLPPACTSCPPTPHTHTAIHPTHPPPGRHHQRLHPGL